jgi:hypothetical protein
VQKYAFCGNQDVPDWILAEIAVLSKVVRSPRCVLHRPRLLLLLPAPVTLPRRACPSTLEEYMFDCTLGVLGPLA